MAGVSLRGRVRCSIIREELGGEPLLICIKRSQLRWFGHLVRILVSKGCGSRPSIIRIIWSIFEVFLYNFLKIFKIAKDFMQFSEISGFLSFFWCGSRPDMIRIIW